MRDEKLEQEGAHRADADDTFMDMTAAWISVVLQELPPSSRVEVLQLLSDLRQNARFDRLTRDVDISGD